MSDFETGTRKAIKTCYPAVKLHSCWFHYCQAIRCKALSSGLFHLFKNGCNARIIYQKLKCLPLLPEGRISEGFDIIVQSSKSVGLHANFKRFFKYFTSFWLRMVTFHACFYYIMIIIYYMCLHKSISITLPRIVETHFRWPMPLVAQHRLWNLFIPPLIVRFQNTPPFLCSLTH